MGSPSSGVLQFLRCPHSPSSLPLLTCLRPLLFTLPVLLEFHLLGMLRPSPSPSMIPVGLRDLSLNWYPCTASLEIICQGDLVT